MKTFIISLVLVCILYLLVSFSQKYLLDFHKEDSRVSSFLERLPNGDVDSQKCNELVAAEEENLHISMMISDGAYKSVKNSPQDKEGYAQQLFTVMGSKYMYSHKLCLAFEKFNQYNPALRVTHPTSTAMFYNNQIVDLGGKEVIAETGSDDISGDKTWLFHQKQEKYLDMSEIWSMVQQLK